MTRSTSWNDSSSDYSSSSDDIVKNILISHNRGLGQVLLENRKDTNGDVGSDVESLGW